MARIKTEYREIARAKITNSRNAIVSHCSRGGYTIAQQLVAREEGEKETAVFLKGAFHVDEISGLYELRDAVNLAIKVSEEGFGKKEEEHWDDDGK